MESGSVTAAVIVIGCAASSAMPISTTQLTHAVVVRLRFGHNSTIPASHYAKG